MKRLIFITLLSAMFPVLSGAQNPPFDNAPIRSFDLPRYLGTWYEIARFDHSFERGLENVTAEYTLRDGECREFGMEGRQEECREGKGETARPKW